MLTSDPIEPENVVFLGFAERAELVNDLGTPLVKWNVIGLKQSILTNFFPVSLSGSHLGIAVSRFKVGTIIKLNLKSPNGKVIHDITVRAKKVDEDEDLENVNKDGITKDSELGKFTLLAESDAYFSIFIPISEFNITILGEGIYSVTWESPEGSRTIGKVAFHLIDPPPLTAERIAAIKASPTSAKTARVILGCKLCKKDFSIYVAIERSKKIEAEGSVWYSNLKGNYICKCGNINIDTSSMQKNLHALLSERFERGGEKIDILPMYEAGHISRLADRFHDLLESAKNEEEIQKFIKSNPVLLHQFPSKYLFFKPSILSKFKADFAIVTPARELILIEIERVQAKILTKAGEVARDLTHAIDQVQNWLHLVDDHRLAVLDMLKVDKNSVSSVKGVVIVGRDRGNDAEHVRKLKASFQSGRVMFLTYDDLYFGLKSLAERLVGR